MFWSALGAVAAAPVLGREVLKALIGAISEISNVV
jgi:hypothetical protein